ncbi:glycosyltransferase family 2 protein [Kutzneria buriramensis]|uniref:Glycosyltransferase involved in cell wall biosynthesis n=1 Tax=Kutzneria buriramensis TaxID=1045776 RepID=A0A3E0GTR1_9PSEU|nr:glycosyltransferase family 2 protein [Kutzneria buriramensis]REH26492.1 glycosyltransferase involved in cell wall biosynthesis [Kutzneria buriramensis]
MPLVSVGLPVYNGVERIEAVVRSVLGQDHADLELVISDNASTDGSEELCRSLAAEDERIVYHRNPVNVGLLNNFVGAIRLGRGEFFRWVGDDDWLAPNCVSRGLDAFAEDPRLVLVTSQVDYTGPDGVTETAPYSGTALRSPDPIVRLREMLRLLNESHLIIDPLYGMVRREPIVRIERINMLREDEVYATKLALAGPWGHVPEVLAKRNWKHEKPATLARRLDVPAWQAHFATTLQCRAMLDYVRQTDALNDDQRRQAMVEVGKMYARRQRIVATRRARKLVRMAGRLVPR